MDSQKKPPEVRRFFVGLIDGSSADRDECRNPEHQQYQGDQ
jgi:hypothetical protein